MKSIIRLNCLWFVFLFLAAGNVQATIRMVTTVADDKTNPPEGSLRHVLTTLVQDCDTVKFADELATDTIQLANSISLFGGSSKATGKSLILVGNGVTITGYYLGGPISSASAMAKLVVENIRFKNAGIAAYANGGHIRHCSFDYKKPSVVLLALGGNITVEVCSFTMEPESDGQGQSLYINLLSDGVSFVSCTFVKAAGTYKSDNYNIFSAKKPTLTNCVVMDYGSSRATFANAPVSNGYNVIRASTSTTGGVAPATFTAQGDTVIPATVTDAPLTFDAGDGIWKVPLASPAYRRLSPQSVLDEIEKLQNIKFPEKDLSGAGIDYTCKTHSGAWQQVFLETGESEPAPECDGVAVTDITLTPPSGTVFTESGTYAITAAVAPSDASPVVTWASSDTNVAEIEGDGNSTGKIKPKGKGKTTITATSVATPSVTASVEIEVHEYVHVTDITLPYDTIRSVHHLEHRFSASISPDNALNKALTWELIDDGGTVNGATFAGFPLLYALKGTKAGTAKLAVHTADGGISDTCVLIFRDPDYTGGVFMLTEGSYPGTGRLNFLYPNGSWDYDIYTGLNNAPVVNATVNRDFGITSQFGAIYGGKFYVTSKQGVRLVVFDPVTMEEHREFLNLPSGDGRFFLGVDERTGYIGTSNGIHVVDLATLCDVPGGYSGFAKAVQTLPATMVEGTQSGSDLYTGQVGTMIRVGERVFAVHQSQGILVIDPRTHTVETTLGAHHYAVLAQSLDGYLWAGATVTEATGGLGDPTENGGQGGLVDATQTYNALIRIDPWTLEEKAFPLPADIGAPPSTWAAWQADPVCGSPTENAIYWIDQKTGPQLIRRYDIVTGTVTTVFDASTCPLPTEFPSARWNMYGPSFRIHPVTGELYVWITLFNLQSTFEQRQVWEVHRINPSTGEKLERYPLKLTYWWPSLFIFPDNEDMEVDASFPTEVTLNAAHPHDTLALRPLVTDADQMPQAIVKTVEAIGDSALVDAFIRHDSLFIVPLKDLAAAQNTTVALKFNSNGRVETRTLTVTVQPGAILHPVTGVTLNRTTADLPVGQTLQLTAVVTPADAENKAVTWTSSNPTIASVDNAGVVTAHLAPSTAVITVTTAEGGFTATCTVTTTAASTPAIPATGVALNRTTAGLTVGETLALTATVTPSNATNIAVTWTSSVPAVASVSNAGVVTALLPGTAVIVAVTADGNHTATCTVTVEAASTPGIEENPFELTQQTLALYPGQTAQLALTAPQHFSVTWSSSSPSVAAVTQTGLVTSLSAGTTRIIARDIAKAKADTCIVTVTALPSEPSYTLTLNTSTLMMIQGERSTLRVTVTPSQAGQTPQWSSSSPAVADVTSDGTVIALSPGTALIRATLGAVSATCAVTVSAQSTQSSVNNIEEDAAQLTFPATADASYYLVHVYELKSGEIKSFLTLKVTPDGRVTLRSMAGNTLVVPLSYLSPGTSYVVHVESVRETDGKAEVIKTEVTTFTTMPPTGTEAVFDASPKAWYASGTLRTVHLDGYVCTVTSASGQHTRQFRVVAPDESHRIQLSPGMYILTAQRNGNRRAFKFAVVR
jgi:uncharacterized protein YjdB